MGSYYFGISPELAIFLQNTCDCQIFVETGTFMGDSAAWASGVFKRVITIEISHRLYKEASERHSGKNIHFLHGNSITHLKSLARLPPPVLFWLDAHWCYGITGGANIQCPLLEEIDIITSSSGNHVILIDDARLTTIPNRHSPAINELPYITDILKALDSHGERYNAVWRDIIISTPMKFAHAVYDFLHSQKDILEIVERHKACDMERS